MAKKVFALSRRFAPDGTRRYAIGYSVEGSTGPTLMLEFYDRFGDFVTHFQFAEHLPLSSDNISKYTLDWVLYGKLPK